VLMDVRGGSTIRGIARHRTDVVVQDKTQVLQFDIGSGLQRHCIVVPTGYMAGRPRSYCVI
jgi:hypothetical protein